MDTDLILTRLYATCLQPFGYYKVDVNGRYKDHNGNPIRVDYDYDLVKIEFLEAFKDKYKPTIMFWNNGRVTVILHVVGYGDFCFPVTGKDEHHRERLIYIPGSRNSILGQRLKRVNYAGCRSCYRYMQWQRTLDIKKEYEDETGTQVILQTDSEGARRMGYRPRS